MPAPVAKSPWERVTWSDVDALAAYADSLGLIAAAGSSWDYTVGATNWLLEADASPGVLNRIRRDLQVVLEEVDAVHGSRGWPEGCVCSGPWILPPECFAAVPGEPDWSGVSTGAAGGYAFLRELVVLANEEMVAVMSRGDVNFNGLVSWDGATFVPDRGWAGSWSGSGWSGLSFECVFEPEADTIGYQGGADGYVFVVLAGSGADVSATVNGAAGSVSEVAVGGAYEYRVDVTGLAGATFLEVVFSWTTGTYGEASDFGCYFSAEYSHSPVVSTGAAVAEVAWSAGPLQEFRVKAAGDWQIADTWLWPEFELPRPEPDYAAWCVVAKTLPVKVVRHQDYGGANRLAPGFALAEAAGASLGGRPEAPSAPMQGSGTASGERDDLGDVERSSFAFAYPHGPTSYMGSQGSVPCWGVAGFWMVRPGLEAYHHAPVLPDVAAVDAGREDAGAELSVEVGLWRGGTYDAGSGPGTESWSGGTFDVVVTETLDAKSAYRYVGFSTPWPVFGNKALVWGADGDVWVTAPVVVKVDVPSGAGGYVGAWDAGWAGLTEDGLAADGTADTFPARPDDAGDAWTEFPGVAWMEAAPVAWWNDLVTLLGLV